MRRRHGRLITQAHYNISCCVLFWRQEEAVAGTHGVGAAEMFLEEVMFNLLGPIL